VNGDLFFYRNNHEFMNLTMFKINGNHLTLIGVTGAGLALVAYVLFGPSNKPKSTRKS